MCEKTADLILQIPRVWPLGSISVNKSDVTSYTLGQESSDNLNKCPWDAVGAPLGEAVD